jgi:hypothetical protein
MDDCAQMRIVIIEQIPPIALTKDAPSGSSRSVRPITATRSAPQSGNSTRIAISIGGVWATPSAHPRKFSSDRLPSCHNVRGMASPGEVATNRPSCSATDLEPVNSDIFFLPTRSRPHCSRPLRFCKTVYPRAGQRRILRLKRANVRCADFHPATQLDPRCRHGELNKWLGCPPIAA